MRLPQTDIEFRNALADAAELGAKKALEGAGLLRPYLKLSEAKRIYGAATVKRWIKERLILPVKDGDSTSTVRIDRLQIETVAKTANRSSYLTTEERKKIHAVCNYMDAE